MAAAHEQQRGAAVDGDAEGGDHHNGPAGDLSRFLQAVDRLDDDAADGDQQQAGIEQRRQDRGPPVAIGVLLRRLLCESHAAPHASSSAITSERL